MAGKLVFGDDGILNTFPVGRDGAKSLELDELVLDPEMCTKDAQRKISEARRFSISSADSEGEPEYKKVAYEHTEHQLTRIRNALSRCYFFSGLSEKQRRIISSAMNERDVETGEIIIEEGGTPTHLYIVEKGFFQVIVKKGTPEEQSVNLYQNSGCFGELSILYSTTRTATVQCAEKGILWELDRATYRHVVVRTQSEKRRSILKFLRNVPLFVGLSEIQLHKISDVCEAAAYNENEYIFREGDFGDRFYIVQEGQCIATTEFKGQEVEIGLMRPGEYFGEISLIYGEPRRANVMVKTEQLVCLRIDTQNFKRLTREFDLQGLIVKGIGSYPKAGIHSPVITRLMANQEEEEEIEDDGFDEEDDIL